MSRSYKNEVPKPIAEEAPVIIKKRFNKRLRKHTKKTLNGYITGAVKPTDEEFQKLYEEEI